MRSVVPCLCGALMVLGLGVVRGQEAASVRVDPDRTVPPVEFAAVVTVSAKGVQIYRCERGEGVVPAWFFVGPEAKLYAGSEPGGVPVGTHGAGPVWRWEDGSAVVGKVVEKQAAPEAGAVPWLLLRATAAPGSADAGRLHDVVYVRRADTHGGTQPAGGCDAEHLEVEARVAYTARYTFYRRG